MDKSKLDQVTESVLVTLFKNKKDDEQVTALELIEQLFKDKLITESTVNKYIALNTYREKLAKYGKSEPAIAEITAETGISRASLYRMQKK